MPVASAVVAIQQMAAARNAIDEAIAEANAPGDPTTQAKKALAALAGALTPLRRAEYALLRSEDQTDVD